MSEFKAITTVYSYYFPEIRRIISELTKEYPHDIFLKSIEPGLDDFHLPIIYHYLAYQAQSVPQLKAFPFRYPTAGAEEGIREVLTLLQTTGIKKIYVLKGEYEGYKEVAKTRGIATIEIEPETNPSSLEKGYWFISNPSARDGNIIPNEFIMQICEAGHQVFYDLTYVGLTKQFEFDVSHPNIFAAVVSFSKPYGLFYYRVGFTFSRSEIPSLYGNKWFKNIFSLLIANEIMIKLDPMDIRYKYEPVQKQIIEKINKEYGLPLKPSDALLLAYLTMEDVKGQEASRLDLIKQFRRGDCYRFCLTPYFEKFEEKSKS